MESKEIPCLASVDTEICDVSSSGRKPFGMDQNSHAVPARINAPQSMFRTRCRRVQRRVAQYQRVHASIMSSNLRYTRLCRFPLSSRRYRLHIIGVSVTETRPETI